MTNEEVLKKILKAKASGSIYLNLIGQHLTSLPPELFQLKKITTLYLGNNQLANLPPELFQMNNLAELDLSSNQLTSLPPEICQLTKLKKLWLGGNLLISPPPEIIHKGIEAIRQYFSSLQAGETPLNQVKILLVGDGAAGKTSLVKRLLGEAFNQHEDTTHGISIRGWDVEAGGQPVKVNIWDFGGQEIMHATHQFFLSRRSLYVLVLDGRKDERPEYWLRHIESFGGDSPVLIVLNKYDANPSFDLNQLFLRQKYPVIRGFHRTSCADGYGIDRFREALLKSLAQVPMIAIRWPKTWFAVKQRIEQMGKPYISCEEYGGLCAEAGLAGDENRETLVGFLHDLGVAVHFKDIELKDTHVLDPKWVTTAVYKIINAKQVADSKGVLHVDSLTEILRRQGTDIYEFPVSMHRYIIELMKQFELCHDLDKQSALVPQLLPVTEPEFHFEWAGSLQFAFLYEDFLPLSILPRFIVKRHKEIKASLCWRTGVVLQDKDSGSEAVVKADYEKRRISLWVNGPRRKEYLHFLWYSLREINASFEKLNVRERVPMPDDPQRTADYETLLKYAQRGNDMYIPDGSDKEYSVRALLGLVQPEREEELRKSIEKIHQQSAGKDSVTDVLNDVFAPTVTFFGITINLNSLFKRLRDWEKRKRG